eukprot:CAMPEP_0201580834 /NCGR_PEP_ID=MMETSP0190_2-20130828/56906_1 /ASSEMBLY_ACC=CAM_ASM_000263 /TAXON_ID=37353 /ORGANISM="Rosalina sp." /LENGTH=635 /DNA_ID=CAMNT_0048017657 /DNA_START=11 /DNA_END=1918 /DNA_ORIENTATION=-
MAQQPQSLSQIYKQFTDTFSPTDNPRDVVRFAKRRLSMDLKYGDVKKFLVDKKKWDERVCEPLDGEFGQDWLFQTIQQSSYYQKWLIDCYFKQKHHTTCAIVSLGIILNAKLLSNYYLSRYDNEDDEDDENKIVEFDSDDEEDMETLKTTLPFLTEAKLIHIFPQYSSRLTIDKVLVEGMGLDQLGQVLMDFGCKSVHVEHCSNMNKQTVSEFRDLCRRTFTRHNMTIDHAIICNFDLWELQTGIEKGHMSPIAAYHEDSDRVLLLDTFTDESWVKVESLYKAMATTSAKTGKFRGYVVAQGTPVFSTSGTRSRNEIDLGSVNPYNNSPEGSMTMNNNRNRNRNRKSRHRKNNSSIDFDFVFDTKQNYNDKQISQSQQQQQRRSSRRLSKKLRLYLEFDSENGQNLWKETQLSQYHQKYLVVEYFQQQTATNYGLVSMAIAFNAKCIANYHNDDHKNNNDGYDSDDELFQINEDKIIELYQSYYNQNLNNKQLLNVPKISKLLSKGMSLEEASDICKLFGCESVETSYVYELEINQFRNIVKDTLKAGSRDSDNVLLVNYDLYKLGTGIANGHISCVAGYNEKNDMVLLMDSMWVIGKIWVPLSLLYESMNTIDDTVGKYRGCIVLNGLPLLDDE